MSMWTSPSASGNSNNNSTTTLTCSPFNSNNSNSKSKSSSTCSSPVLTANKSMEQVWNDITLDSDLHHHSTTVSPTALQDFLATPFHKYHPPNKDASISYAADTTLLPYLPSQPVGLLSLNSGSGVVDLGILESTTATTVPVRAAGPQSQTVVNATPTPSNLVATYNSPVLDTLGSSSVFPSSTNNTKKRPQENGDNSTDRRHKRMIKNRESAARSRARKQAYTNELEIEVAHLREENARLRRQQTKLSLAAAARLPKKHTLYRTLTAPF